MAKKNQKRIPASLQPWINARRRFRLSHEHVQMARELGMNPKKLGKLDNHHQEPWKLPLRQFIRTLYFKRFGKERPNAVRKYRGNHRGDAGEGAVQESRARPRTLDGRSA